MMRLLLFQVLLVCGTGLLRSAYGGDYLPAVGPPPLRFGPPSTAVPARFLLPLFEAPATETTPALVEPTNSASATPLTLPAPVTNAPPAVSQAETSVVPIIPVVWPTNTLAFPAPEPPLAPQMFLHYFTRGTGTNGAGGSVFMPLNFLPPLPLGPLPSSSVTYEVTPAPKP